MVLSSKSLQIHLGTRESNAIKPCIIYSLSVIFNYGTASGDSRIMYTVLRPWSSVVCVKDCNLLLRTGDESGFWWRINIVVTPWDHFTLSCSKNNIYNTPRIILIACILQWNLVPSLKMFPFLKVIVSLGVMQCFCVRQTASVVETSAQIRRLVFSHTFCLLPPSHPACMI